MDFKAVKFETKAISDDIFEGYASFFNNIDAYDDIIEKGAFRKTISENRSRIKVLWQHDANEPIGLPIDMTEDDNGLYVKAKISMTDTGKKAMTLIKDGVITEMSIGYDVVKDDYKMLGTKRVRLLKEVKLWEFSPVTFAANEKAKIMKMRGLLESVKADKMDTAISLIRSLGAQPSQDTDDIEPSIVLDMIKKLRG
jgi:HK97 family phage prohead protease